MDASKVSNSQPSPATLKARRNEEAQLAQLRKDRVQEREQIQKNVEDKPKPTTNGQGQTIGTRLNVTA
jgi:hypothetical protein